MLVFFHMLLVIRPNEQLEIRGDIGFGVNSLIASLITDFVGNVNMELHVEKIH